VSPRCPLARSEGLITEELDGELLVYDSESNLAHALDADAAALWRGCDGRTDTRTLAACCHTSHESVRVTLARLQELGLLEVEREGDTRREALRKITIAGAGLATIPTISSIVVPTAAQAASGQMITEYSVPAPRSFPYWITAGTDGALWFTEYLNNHIGRVTTSGAFTEYPIPTAGSTPEEITTGPDGALWFAEFNGNKIGRVTTAGAFTEYPIPTSGSFPSGITAGPDGALWFTETSFGANKIGRVTTSGAFTEYPIPTPASHPLDITTGPDGALWFTESSGNKIGRVTTAGAFTEYPIPTSASEPIGITSGPDGALWFTEELGNKIGRITPP
jgi:streptogramin lyase